MAQQEVIERALTDYLEAIKPVGVVNEVIVGVGPEVPARIFNVTKDDFSRERADDPRYKELRRFGTNLENSLADILQLLVSSVNPSQLNGFLEDCARRGFELRRIPVSVDILP